MSDLTRLDAKYVWSDKVNKAFIELKNQFESADIVRHFNNKLPIILETDASAFAISGIVSQIHPDGIHPTGFFSRKLRDAEVNYDTHDCELLAIIESLKAWRHWLMETPTPVTVLSDHNNLKYFMSSKELNRRQVRWAQFLADFNIEIHHRPGKFNVCADALSRKEEYELDMGDKARLVQCLLPEHLFARSVSKILNDPNRKAPILPNVRKVTSEQGEVHSELEKEIILQNQKDEYYNAAVKWYHTFPAKRNPFPPGSGRLKPHVDVPDSFDKTENGFLVKDGVLFYHGRLYVPEACRLTILTACHDSPLAGHWGAKKTQDFISRDFWWPHLQQTVSDYVGTCQVCQRTKAARDKPSGLLHPLPVPSARWASVTMDFMVSLPDCKGYNSIMVVVDRFTKMAHFVPCTNTITGEETAVLYIDRVFRHHGIPTDVTTDRGTQFNSDFWKRFWAQLNVDVRLSTSYHPETDGQSERINSILNQYLRVYTSFLQDDWVDHLATAEFTYNNSVHSATGFTPFFANTGMNMGTEVLRTTSISDEPSTLASKLQEIHSFLEKNLEFARSQMKKFADVNHKPSPTYKEGDQVLLSTENLGTLRPKPKWADKRVGPYKVIKEVHPNTDSYLLDLKGAIPVFPMFHASLLTPYRGNNIIEREVEIPPPEIIDGEEEFVIQQILDHRSTLR